MLEIDDLHKRYGDIAALDGCSFTVTPGRMLGFLGRNGAGKTTTMRAVFGLLTPDAGEVRWHGRRVTDADRTRFGYMPEERGLYGKMRIAERLTYFGRLHGMGHRSARRAADRWLADLGLSDRAGDPLHDLSQGNQQRVQLAAALIHDPEVLVLDEPFNGLDPIGAATMAHVLADRAAAGAAVVFSSHQLDVVEDLCEDLAIIDGGRIILAGQVAQLKADAPTRVVELDLTGAQADVLVALDGVLDARSDGHHHTLTVTRDIDLRRLLEAVDAHDRPGSSDALDHVVYTTPSLADLFIEAVGERPREASA